METQHQLTVNGREFKVNCLLGKGKGGYSYLVTDPEGKRLVLKQIHHEPCSYYQFGDKLASELRDYERLKQIGIRMPLLLDVDAVQERILKEYIEGPTVAQLVMERRMQGPYIDQVREMCGILYAANINIDYYPTNFVVRDEEIYYIDYECNEYMERWNFENWGIRYWYPVLDTCRLTLRHFTLQDRDHVMEYLNDPEMACFLDWDVVSAENAENAMQTFVFSDEILAVEHHDLGRVVGQILLKKGRGGSAEIRCLIHPGFRRQGIAAEACQAVMDMAFKSGIGRIYARCKDCSPASTGLAKRLGMVPETAPAQASALQCREPYAAAEQNERIYSVEK